jgi:hypothetical protein
MMALKYVGMAEKDGFAILQKKEFGTSQQLRLLLHLKTADSIMIDSERNSEL